MIKEFVKMEFAFAKQVILVNSAIWKHHQKIAMVMDILKMVYVNAQLDGKVLIALNRFVLMNVQAMVHVWMDNVVVKKDILEMIALIKHVQMIVMEEEDVIMENVIVI